ncbi:MAG TPA: carbohydrate porin [Phycisphaerae bacterium]|nr:carbohydrate porin [Phycisphaerae bacterium]
MHVRQCALGACFLLLLAAGAPADDAVAPGENPNTAPPAQPERGDQATGDWAGWRTRLENAGVTVHGTLDLDTSHVLRGGVDTEKVLFREFTDLNATLDFAKLLQWQGASMFIDFSSHHGPDASAKGAGDIISFDDIEDPPYIALAQCWFAQKLPGGFQAEVGKIDPIVDFAHMAHAELFLSSAALYPPTIFPMPTGAHDAGGAEIFWQPRDQGPYAGVGAYDDNRDNHLFVLEGHPEKTEATRGGMFLIGETGLHDQLGEAKLPGQLAVGGWYHTGQFPRINGPAVADPYARGAGGAYAFLDQSFFHEPQGANSVRDLGGFLQAGWADPRTSAIDANLSLGLTATGFIPQRPDDSVGILAAYVHLPTRGLSEDHEAAFEAFYHCRLLPCLELKPDLQYILSPSGQFPDALVATFRIQIDF